MVANVTRGARDDSITVTKGVAAGVDVALKFWVGVADDNGLELSNSDGDAKYVVNGVLYPSSTNDTVGQYGVKVDMIPADKTLWANSLIASGKASADVAVTITGVYDAEEASPSDVQTVLLQSDATKGSDAKKATNNQHSITVHFVASTQALTISKIEGTDASATTKINGSANTEYYTNAKALFAMRPRYQATSTNFDTATSYTDTTNAKYFVIGVGGVTTA